MRTTRLLLRLGASLLATMLVARGSAQDTGAAGSGQGSEAIEQLRSRLAQPGPDAQEGRETAIETLLGMPTLEAHAVLHQLVGPAGQRDNVDEAILAALLRRLRNQADPVFGEGRLDPAVRAPIVLGYVGPLAHYWVGNADAEGLLEPDDKRRLARSCIVRLPVPELEAGLRKVAASADVDLALRIAALRCAADGQNLLLGHLLASFLDSDQQELRRAARLGLRLLTFAENDFASAEQFAEWWKQNEKVRYFDLAEQAARESPRRARRLRDEVRRLQVDSAVEFVRSRTDRTPGVDWAAVQARVLVADLRIVDACLVALREILQKGLPNDEQAPARQAFARALLQRFQTEPVDQVERRAQLLEVAAYLGRIEEPELAAELVAQLGAALGSPATALQQAAVRGFRRFPTADNRALLVRTAIAALEAQALPLLGAVLATLGSSDAPRWTAPLPEEPCAEEWLRLLRSVCENPATRELRAAALTVLLRPDSKDQRRPQAFDLLLDLVKDPAQGPEFRVSCLLHLQDWRDRSEAADKFVAGVAPLLQDGERDVRRTAALALAKVPSLGEQGRADRTRLAIAAIRDRLSGEGNPTVLRALTESLTILAHEPEMPGVAIGALNHVLADLKPPVAADQQFRLEALLQALTTVGADPRADKGQWLGACPLLLRHEKRRSLRLVLEAHDAPRRVALVNNEDPTIASRAREALQHLVRTALLKPAKDSWTSTDELKREARDVRAALAALERVQEPVDDAALRLLRLEVELAVGNPTELLVLANRYLAEADGGARPGAAMDAAQKDQVRLLAAEAQFAAGRHAEALALLDQRDPMRAREARTVDLMERLARALMAGDPNLALSLYTKVLAATGDDDPALRTRLLGWAVVRLQVDPGSRGDVLAQLDRRAPLFEAPDCPAEQKEQFAQLRAQR